MICSKEKVSRLQSGSLHVTQKVDYGLFLLSVLARHAESKNPKMPSISKIAGDHHLSFSFLQKVAHALKREGFIRSHRGKDGGYTLVKNPKVILLKEVIESLEGPITAPTCFEEASHACPRKSFCAIRAGFERMNSEIAGLYLSKTLSDFLS